MRFVIIVQKGLTARAFGVYRSFKAADADAKAWGGIILRLENQAVALNPWDAAEDENEQAGKEAYSGQRG